MAKLKAPMPYFGEKAAVAEMVWDRLGQVQNVIEPFCGSLAVLLARPRPFSGVETVNDLDCRVSNVWRSLQRDPEAVAEWADSPVVEVDLHSTHRWLTGAF